MLQALESNDPALARRYAFDVAALRSGAGRVEEFPEAAVLKEVLGDKPENTTALELQLGLETPTALRLDRLLASELGISRSRLQAWEEKRLLVVGPDGAKALRKPPRAGMVIRIELVGEPDREATSRLQVDKAR